MIASAPLPAQCPNCGRRREGAFCASCGQKAAPLNPSLGEFLHDLFHELAHFDGKIVGSVKLLLFRPGFLSLEQFEGRRARYVSPIRLYLVFSVLFFALSALQPPNAVRVSATPDEPIDPADVQKLVSEANEAVVHWTPRAMFVLVPVFAGLIALAAKGSRRNYPQHLYFALHVHAAWFVAAAANAAAHLTHLRPVERAIAALVPVYVTVYFVLALRRAYALTTGRAAWRAALVGGAYVVVVLLTLITIVFPTFRRSGLM